MTDRALRPVFTALADPTRRAILDLLRKRERTTGELAAAFPSSRFAVMKHVSVLQAAGLVVSRREGRERWNRLNAVPLQRLYERWVRPYEAMWAGPLLTLEKAATEGEGEMATKKKTAGREVRAVESNLEITIDAPRARVWKALVDEATGWWRKDFYVGKDPKGFHIEAKPGGRMYEDWGGGAGLLWYTVHAVNPGVSLDLFGHLAPRYGGPATTLVHIELADAGARTTLRLHDAIYGAVSEDFGSQTDAGWMALMDDGLRPYVEANPKTKPRVRKEHAR